MKQSGRRAAPANPKDARLKRRVIAVWGALGLVGLILLAVVLVPLLLPSGPVAAEEPQRVITTPTSTPSPSAVESVPTETATPEPSEAETPSLEPEPVPPVDTPVPPVVEQLPEAPAEGEPTRVVYPEVSIDMAVVPMTVSEGVLNAPPVDSNAHWLNNFGKPGKAARDTVYIVAHSCGLGAENCSPQTFPFNNLSDKARAGQRITVATSSGDVHYRVTRTMLYPKTGRSPEKDEAWKVSPDRLVLISCYTQDLLGTNFAVIAQREK